MPLREELNLNTKKNEVSSDEDDGIEPVDISRIQKRSFVAVDKKEWSNRPQIGQVEEILKDKIKIKWLHGIMTYLRTTTQLKEGKDLVV